MSYFPNSDFFLQIRQGLISGYESLSKFGRNASIDIGSSEDVWSGGGIWVPPTAARVHDLVSTDANDTNAAGTGMRQVRVIGLDGSWNQVSEIIDLNGLTPVPTVNSYFRIFTMENVSSGSGGANAGTITATAQTDLTVTARIEIGYGETEMAIYTVPAGKTAYLYKYHGSLNRGTPAGTSADFAIIQKLDASQSNAPILTRHSIGCSIDGGNPYVRDFATAPLVFTEKSDIILRCLSVSSNATLVDGGFDCVIVDN